MEFATITPGGRLYLVYDPHDRYDVRHAARIRERIAETILVRKPFVGHGTVRPLSSTPIMAGLIEAARAHDDDGVERVVWGARRANPERAKRVRECRQRRSYGPVEYGT